MSMMMLEVKDLEYGYSDFPVLNGVSFSVKEKEVVAILGSNGVGKTTTLYNVAGAYKPWSGSVFFNGKDITGMPAHEVVRLGLVLVPEGKLLFGKLTVHENLTMGAYFRKDADKIKQSFDMVCDLFPRVKERLTQKAETLSGGEQQMVAISRGLMSDPTLLILDEPSLGIMPKLVKEIFEFIDKIRQMGISVVIVEQNAKESLQLAQRAYVLQDGKMVIEGNAEDLMNNDDVRKVYLGIN